MQVFIRTVKQGYVSLMWIGTRQQISRRATIGNTAIIMNGDMIRFYSGFYNDKV